MVPVALINFDKVVEPNWDLTMAKVRLSQPAIIRTKQHLGPSIYRRN
jgi:hypothetical protein